MRLSVLALFLAVALAVVLLALRRRRDPTLPRGRALDVLAGVWNVKRRPWESDRALRARLRAVARRMERTGS